MTLWLWTPVDSGGSCISRGALGGCEHRRMRDAGQQLRAARKAVSYPPLFTWLWRAAINVRIHACVVERAGQDRYSDRAGTAAVDVIRVIAALCGGYTADDQPDDKKCRSEMHPGLRQ